VSEWSGRDKGKNKEAIMTRPGRDGRGRFSGVELVERYHDVVTEEDAALHLRAWWITAHFLGFFIGGMTFLAGTSTYFYPDGEFLGISSAVWGGWLYLTGSCNFLGVDMLEFLTFTEDPALRLNILLSASGSFAYVVGSVGFLPEVTAYNPLIGIYGIIAGSFLIGVSQFVKICRIGGGMGARKTGFRCSNLCADVDSFTETCMEFSGGCGAWCFYVGTIMYDVEFDELSDDAQLLNQILYIWLLGSACFTLGAFFLGFRHFVMKV
jgi:hypothetical protein